MNVGPQELFDQVVEQAPSFEGLRRSHLDAFKEFLPHLLMYDLVLFVKSHFTGMRCEGVEPPSEAELRAVFDVLDRGFAEGDDATRNVIAVSFVESIGIEPEFKELKPRFGPMLLEEWDRQREWKP